MKICLLIPAYNESRNIGKVIEAIKAKGLDIVVVDDGSGDGTGQIARDKGAVVIANDQRTGKGTSLRRGFEHILHQDYEGIITMDGDGQHDVEDIDRFLARAREHEVSVITGNRMADTQNMPFIRFCTNRFMSGLISLACRQSIADTQCGYRYISCDILRAIALKCTGYEIESEILLKSSKKGFKVYSVPIKTIYRDETSNINPIVDSFRFFTYFVKEICSLSK